MRRHKARKARAFKGLLVAAVVGAMKEARAVQVSELGAGVEPFTPEKSTLLAKAEA